MMVKIDHGKISLFAPGVWNYEDFNRYIKEITAIKGATEKEDKYPITSKSNDTTFRVKITMDEKYQLDLTKSNFYDLIGFDKEIVTAILRQVRKYLIKPRYRNSQYSL